MSTVREVQIIFWKASGRMYGELTELDRRSFRALDGTGMSTCGGHDEGVYTAFDTERTNGEILDRLREEFPEAHVSNVSDHPISKYSKVTIAKVKLSF